MNFVRKAGVLVASTLLLFFLFGLVTSTGVSLVFGNRTNVKTWIKESKAYDNFVESILAESQKNIEKSQEGNEVPLNRPEIQSAAKQAFSPAFLQSSAEQFIDGSYDWLEGKSDKPNFQIDVGSAKSSFISNLNNYLVQRVKGLPACTPRQVPDEFDPFTIECLPPGINAETEINKVTDELASSKDFLPNTTITADNLQGSTQEGQQTQTEPFYKQFSDLPQQYQWLKLAPIIFGVLTLLATALIIFGSSTWRGGIRYVAISLLLAGILLLFGILINNAVVSEVEQRATAGTSPAFVKQTLPALLHSLVAAFNRVNLWFGLGFIAVGGGSLIGLAVSRKPAVVVSDNSPVTLSDEPRVRK